jgi:membrane protein implicated in regulation of membrane protease activity
MDIVSWMIALDYWNWFIAAAVLFVIEIVAPGSFMIWLGLSAIVVGTTSLFIEWSWQAQVITFAVIAVALIPAWRRFARSVEKPVDRPFLNRRAEGYVGRIFTLDKPIIDGVGTIRIDDTVWRVSGPDCPAGSRVKIARADGANLLVEAAAEQSAA